MFLAFSGRNALQLGPAKRYVLQNICHICVFPLLTPCLCIFCKLFTRILLLRVIFSKSSLLQISYDASTLLCPPILNSTLLAVLELTVTLIRTSSSRKFLRYNFQQCHIIVSFTNLELTANTQL